MYHFPWHAGYGSFYDWNGWHPSTLHALCCRGAFGYTECIFFWTLCVICKRFARQLVQGRRYWGKVISSLGSVQVDWSYMSIMVLLIEKIASWMFLWNTAAQWKYLITVVYFSLFSLFTKGKSHNSGNICFRVDELFSCMFLVKLFSFSLLLLLVLLEGISSFMLIYFMSSNSWCKELHYCLHF